MELKNKKIKTPSTGETRSYSKGAATVKPADF